MPALVSHKRKLRSTSDPMVTKIFDSDDIETENDPYGRNKIPDTPPALPRVWPVRVARLLFVFVVAPLVAWPWIASFLLFIIATTITYGLVKAWYGGNNRSAEDKLDRFFTPWWEWGPMFYRTYWERLNDAERQRINERYEIEIFRYTQNE